MGFWKLLANDSVKSSGPQHSSPADQAQKGQDRQDRLKQYIDGTLDGVIFVLRFFQYWKGQTERYIL